MKKTVTLGNQDFYKIKNTDAMDAWSFVTMVTVGAHAFFF